MEGAGEWGRPLPVFVFSLSSRQNFARNCGVACSLLLVIFPLLPSQYVYLPASLLLETIRRACVQCIAERMLTCLTAFRCVSCFGEKSRLRWLRMVDVGLDGERPSTWGLPFLRSELVAERSLIPIREVPRFSICMGGCVQMVDNSILGSIPEGACSMVEWLSSFL